jgi:DNA-binding CsgD family transcriptional regulator
MFDTTIIDQLPYAIVWKDTNCVYCGGNQLFLQAAGVVSVNMLIGKSDFDMPWGKLYAESYREDDFNVIRGNAKLDYIEPHIQASGKKVMVRVNKKPWYNKEGIVRGLVCSFNVINDDECASLPSQQIKCLQLTAAGLTAKQIAKEMNLTPRTIEFYLQIIKQKLACRNKLQLIRKAYSLGLL